MPAMDAGSHSSGAIEAVGVTSTAPVDERVQQGDELSTGLGEPVADHHRRGRLHRTFDQTLSLELLHARGEQAG